ncbi:hypothetical protein PG994_010179 [Apiospora phragmitis]|uniref:Uncharacterized protein n=1 Tax=Apiospora phragmitis TaxID=2905665 RepID=A0ABR1TP57_9PEZI
MLGASILHSVLADAQTPLDFIMTSAASGILGTPWPEKVHYRYQYTSPTPRTVTATASNKGRATSAILVHDLGHVGTIFRKRRRVERFALQRKGRYDTSTESQDHAAVVVIIRDSDHTPHQRRPLKAAPRRPASDATSFWTRRIPASGTPF